MKTDVLGDKIRGKIEFLKDEKKRHGGEKKNLPRRL
jgi:hypothetical protein